MEFAVFFDIILTFAAKLHKKQFIMKQFKFLNNMIGWLLFVVASFVYLLTIEPTVSFWDCGEFITSSYRLEVGHPPGAPFFMILARVFTLFASDVSQVAALVNSLSALSSAFTILFLFWTLSHLLRRIIIPKNEFNTENMLLVFGSAAVASLAYTFSDTFWFSAVEGEVYAMSSLFTAVVFWAILKWEEESLQQFGNRWIILIAYLIGLSIGVHLLNLLAIPAMVFIVYFKKYKPTRRGLLFASGVAVLLLAVVMYGIIHGVVLFASWFELLFVNSFGLPFNSGLLFYAVLLVGALSGGIYYTLHYRKVLLNTALLAFAVILIGYSSFALIFVRSQAEPPMNQNKPDNIFSLLSYLNREQYGDRPLFFGHYFNAELESYEDGQAVYRQSNGRYEVVDRKVNSHYNSDYNTFFPRMYSSTENPPHVAGYLEWAGLEEKDYYNPRFDAEGNVLRDRYGDVLYDHYSPKKKPSMAANLRFFFSYQVWHMYVRYFMWNFVGRQNDIQSDGSILYGNWLSGISAFDDWRLGEQNLLDDFAKDNPARNTYFFLPLLLGILGLVYLYQNHKQYFAVLLMLFFFTGLAIVMYLNQTPAQPRERDYAYVGSFYVFAIFMAFGIPYLFSVMKKWLSGVTGVATVVLLSFLTVPLLMAFENWDDHDRSGRYTARDFASNYLNTCKKDAILFTNGDNDTFPLWYAQDVEGIRTDVRVVNLSYLATDWYIDQMKRQAFDSKPVPFSMSSEKYLPGTREVVYLQDLIEGGIDLREAVDFVASDNPKTKRERQNGGVLNFIPSHTFELAIDSAYIADNKVVEPDDFDKIVKKMKWRISKEYIRKNDLMVLDLMATNNWKRPIYYAITVGDDSYMNLQSYFQNDGMAYRLVPIETPTSSYMKIGRINSKLMYDNLMNKFNWTTLEDSTVYFDENNRRMLTNIRHNFMRLAQELNAESKPDSAIAVLDKCEELVPDMRVPYNYYSLLMAKEYHRAGAKEKSTKIIRGIADTHLQMLKFFTALPASLSNKTGQEFLRKLALLQEIISFTAEITASELHQSILSNTVNMLEKLPYVREFSVPTADQSRLAQVYNALGENEQQIIALYMGLKERQEMQKMPLLDE